MEMLTSLHERENQLEKVQNESFNTKSSPTLEVDNKENSNTHLQQNKPVLMNQVKDSHLPQNVIVYKIPETDLDNSNKNTNNLLSKFKQLIAVCKMNQDREDKAAMYCLRKKSDDNSRI